MQKKAPLHNMVRYQRLPRSRAAASVSTSK